MGGGEGRGVGDKGNKGGNRGGGTGVIDSSGLCNLNLVKTT